MFFPFVMKVDDVVTVGFGRPNPESFAKVFDLSDNIHPLVSRKQMPHSGNFGLFFALELRGFRF